MALNSTVRSQMQFSEIQNRFNIEQKLCENINAMSQRIDDFSQITYGRKLLFCIHTPPPPQKRRKENEKMEWMKKKADAPLSIPVEECEKKEENEK